MSDDRFASRRAHLLARLGDTLAVIPAGREQIRNDDVPHPFRQDSDFHFLTGFSEPDAVAVFDATSDQPYTLFVRQRDPEAEAWTGRRAGVEGARERFGADVAYPLEALPDQLRVRLAGRRSVGYAVGGPVDDAVLGAVRAVRGYARKSGVQVPVEIVDVRALLHELRLVKSADEIEALREACRISAAAHTEAMRFAAPGRTERQVQAVVEYVFGVMGAERVGYGSIVAGGENACILHYIENAAGLEDGELLLVDAGAEYRHLTSDITRTFPVNGRFSTPQRELYQLVLRAQQEVMAMCRPGLPFTDMHARAVEVLSAGLVELGLLPGPAEEVVAKGWYRQFFFHGTGHWLGIDVHDAGTTRLGGEGRLLEPGMAFTVEPGVYVAREKAALALSHAAYDPDERLRLTFELGRAGARAEIERREADAGTFAYEVPPAFLGLGIRIEDDLLITDDGYENLSAAAPVEPDEVEARCAEDSVLPVFD
ncbi:MAG: aminopeptidase P N-terminal domain-containing protein [Chloroflexota bacterium]|jgi:Xaa-Pro aminopeptidase